MYRSHTIDNIVTQIEPLDLSWINKAQERLDMLTKPQGSLGRLEKLAQHIVAITRTMNPVFSHKLIVTMAADHGIAQEAVSAYPQEVTLQMVRNFLKGGAAINVLAAHANARLVVVDIGVKGDLGEENIMVPGNPGVNLYHKKIREGTWNMRKGPAMSLQEAVQSLEYGVSVFEEEYLKGIDLVGLGDMGIGNTSASSVITAVMTRCPVAQVTGRGTGINDLGLVRKKTILEEVLSLHQPDYRDSLDVLSKIGGFEIGGLTGLILAACARHVPVVLDGFISTAAALLACGMCPHVKDYLIASGCSAERGHKIQLEALGLSPLFDFQMRLGEGTAAALGMHMVEASIKLFTGMATFESAKVTEKVRL